MSDSMRRVGGDVFLVEGRSPRQAREVLMAELLQVCGGSDFQRLESQSEQLFRLSQIFGNSPFTRLEEARGLLGLGRKDFADLLGLVPRVETVRALVAGGASGQYWANTILPLESTGALDSVLAGEPRFPTSVGLYPGPTCMFRCNFCVRVTGVKYDSALVDPGTHVMEKVIDECPTDDPRLLYFSGGLEPLTNPHLGSLVRRAARRGFEATLYTNSFALTEHSLAAEAGLWGLWAIRTSLYGLSDAEYLETVGRSKSFGRVRRNLHGFLAARERMGGRTRLGLSYLILPGRAHRLDQLVDFLVELQIESGGRGVDFLSLRQDYSGRKDGTLGPGEVEGLVSTLARFDGVVRERLPSLHVDYGYALHSILCGRPAPLPRIGVSEMRPRAHPQVAVQVDLAGDVYLYREAGFPGLLGADRYICGRVDETHSLRDVVDAFVREGRGVRPREGDQFFMDGFDQVVTARLNQLSEDLDAGWGPARGFLR